MSRISILLLLALSLHGQAPAPQEAGRLPVKRVVLYKNGVGYFEHVGKVRDNQTVTIPFTSGQLNDVLKSLTVLDLNGGRITGVAYGSSAPVDRQLGELRLSLGDKATLSEVLGSLRGARLEIRSGTNVIGGRLLSIERKTRSGGGTTLEVDYVSVVTDGGEVRTTELSPFYTVKLLDRDLAQRLERFLDVVAAGRDADVRRMTISTEGTGERSVFVSYISEVPVWKSTYRIVLSSKAGQAPLLQGWAIVDNTVGLDWDNVQMSLVAGAPQSFVQNLSQPYYTRRPVVPLPEAMAVSPQTYEATLIPGGARLAGKVMDPSGSAIAGATVRAFDANGTLAGETTSGADGNYEFTSLPDGAYRVEFQSAEFNRTSVSGVAVAGGQTRKQDARLEVGDMAQTVEVKAEASPLQASTATVAAVQRTTAGTGGMLGSGAALGAGGARTGAGRGGGIGSGSGAGVGPGIYQTRPAATAQELGDLFEYKLKDPITIQKNRSALLPIVQAQIGAEKVSVWNERTGLPRPLRALWLTNSSGVTLDGGSFSVMEEETFAGEGIFDPIRPGEKRLVSYAVDLALNESSRLGSEQQRVTRVRVSRGIMTQENEVRERKTYTFRNEDTQPRSVIVEHPVRPGYELRSEPRPEETTADWMRFRVRVDPKQTASLVVEEARPVATTYNLTNLNGQQVDLFVRQKSINPELEEALRRVLGQKNTIADLEEKKNARDAEMNNIFDDQQRLRENMKALKGSPEEKALLLRYTKQLDDQENRLEALRKETQQLEAQAESAQAELDRMIEGLSFDVRM